MKAKRKKPVILPKIPSKLIRLALKDLEWVEKRKKIYKVDMYSWHEPNSHCSVCLAGAVMANTLKCDPKDEVRPEYIPRNKLQLRALDYFREGFVRYGLSNLIGQRVTKFSGDQIGNRVITEYSDNKRRFKSQMRKMADDLEKLGL